MLFYSREETLLIDTTLFKSLIIVVASITAAILMVWYFFRVTGSYTREAEITSGVWLVMKWALDIVVLIGLLGMTP
jgi:hypothetical protein